VLLANFERTLHRALIAVAVLALASGIGVWFGGFGRAATWIWGVGTAPVIPGLFLSMIRDVRAGRVGVDAVALVAMSTAILLGETLAGVVVAIMYSGGGVLEDFAVGRAERPWCFRHLHWVSKPRK